MIILIIILLIIYNNVTDSNNDGYKKNNTNKKNNDKKNKQIKRVRILNRRLKLKYEEDGTRQRKNSHKNFEKFMEKK